MEVKKLNLWASTWKSKQLHSFRTESWHCFLLAAATKGSTLHTDFYCHISCKTNQHCMFDLFRLKGINPLIAAGLASENPSSWCERNLTKMYIDWTSICKTQITHSVFLCLWEAFDIKKMICAKPWWLITVRLSRFTSVK